MTCKVVHDFYGSEPVDKADLAGLDQSLVWNESNARRPDVPRPSVRTSPASAPKYRETRAMVRLTQRLERDALTGVVARLANSSVRAHPPSSPHRRALSLGRRRRPAAHRRAPPALAVPPFYLVRVRCRNA